jgi:lipopolysaccharide/colanic/teichoic acid biosynthesis glycosyltransferase
MNRDRSKGDRSFVQDTLADGTVLWQQVDAALQEGHQVWLRSPLLGILADAIGQEYDGHQWLVIESRRERAIVWNRLRDLLLSSMALVLLSPLLLVVGVLIKTGSQGPVFFATIVVGRDRRPFVWHKLRSMRVVPENEDIERRRAKFQAYVEGTRVGADESTSGSQSVPKKVIENRRVTPVGRIIRKYSIDELPQLWNVLRGEMSLLGPRPCLPYEAEFYRGWRGRRFQVEPGLSGIWQVFGRGRVGFDEAAAMDVYYVYRRSFRFDLYLIYKTLGVVFTGRGAL